MGDYDTNFALRSGMCELCPPAEGDNRDEREAWLMKQPMLYVNIIVLLLGLCAIYKHTSAIGQMEDSVAVEDALADENTQRVVGHTSSLVKIVTMQL